MNYYLIIPLLILVLYLGKFLILPLLFSFLIFIILKSLSKKLSSISTFNFSLNYYLSFVIICLSLLFFFYFVGTLVQSNLSRVIENSDIYQDNIQEILSIIQKTKINLSFLSIEDLLKNINFGKILSNILNFFTNAAGNISLILIYLIFFIIEEKFFKIKLNKIFPNKSTKRILTNINNQIYGYFEIKTFTSLLTGFLTFIILTTLSNDLAIVFGIFAFLLNFIPFIGSLVSILIPFVFSLIQTLELPISIITLISLTFSQLLIGNFVEPKLMGKSLNLSPIIMLIFLGIFGKIWGISGMFLSVPILVVLLIVFSNFNQTKAIAVFLSEKGNIK